MKNALSKCLKAAGAGCKLLARFFLTTMAKGIKIFVRAAKVGLVLVEVWLLVYPTHGLIKHGTTDIIMVSADR